MATVMYEIHEGFWTNWSEGRFVGATLTLSQRNGAYLIAFLALFVHLAGASLWRLTSFILFQTKARLGANNRSALEQQVVLRNGSSAITSLSVLVTAALRSSKRRKYLVLICWALLNFIAFLAAGVLSSKVASKQPEVLLQPTKCGRWQTYGFSGSKDNYITGSSSWRETGLEWTALHNLHLTSSRFAYACYRNADPNDGCLWFARKPLTWTSALNSGCTFNESICLDNTTFSIDSNWLDSDRDLGINSAAEDRIRMRIQTRCSPLKRDGYYQTYDANNISTVITAGSEYGSWKQQVVGRNWQDARFEAFFYGTSPNFGAATFIYSNASGNYPFRANQPPDYALKVQVYEDCTKELYESGRCFTTFKPIPELRKSDNDIILVFLTSTAEYCGPVTDPWFAAQVCGSDRFFGSEYGDWKACRPAHPVSTLGCTVETEICVGGSNESRNCAKLRASGYPFEHGEKHEPPDLAKILGLNPRQTTIARRLQDASYRSSFSSIISDMGAENMLAHTSEPLCAAVLPHDQWTREIENWFATQLVNIQLYTTQFVTGWQYGKADKYVTYPPEAERWMCDAQVVQSPLYASFSVLGLGLVFVLGGALIALRFCTPRIIHKLQPSARLNEHRLLSWDSLDLLEMAKEVFEKEQVLPAVERYSCAYNEGKG